MDLAKEIYKLAKKLPKEEMFALSDQMRRAAISIPSNIAEGSARNSTKEYLQFLSIAKGALAELETQLLLCIKIKYFSFKQTEYSFNKIDELEKIIGGVKTKLSERLKNTEH